MEDRIKEILAEELSLDVAEIAMESSIKDDLGADSIDMMQVVDVLEQEFDIEVDTSDLQEIITVNDIVTYLKNKG